MINKDNGSSNGGLGGPGSKSMGQIRNKKMYDHSFHSGGSGNGLGADLYESRHNDVRSPSMHHHHHGLIGGVGNGLGSNNGLGMNGQSHEQMNAMMSMFNPMMAAFIQQLASGIQPPNAGSQSVLDPNSHVNGSGLGHHHAPPPWASNDYARSTGANGSAGLASMPANVGGYGSAGYNGNAGGSGGGGAGVSGASGGHSRFKQEKNF